MAYSQYSLIYKQSLLNALLDTIYPVGSIYISITNTSPASFLGGDWSPLPEGYALWTASSGAGSTISPGLPNITGKLQRAVCDSASGRGAFNKIGESYQAFGGTGANWRSAWFDANAGETGTDGYVKPDGTDPSLIMNYRVYGKSDTVQPPAYKVYAWKRTA